MLTAQASDTGRFGDIPGAVYATLTQNAVSGYATGIGLVSDGDTVFATIGSTSPSDSNTINGIGVVGGSTGILLSGSGVSATIENNSSTIENNSVGIDVAHDATATISGNKFTANAVDLLIEQTAGTITIGDGNAFSGTADYIENLSSENFDLSGDLTTTFGGFNAAQTVVTTATWDPSTRSRTSSSTRSTRRAWASSASTPATSLSPPIASSLPRPMTPAPSRAVNAASGGNTVNIEAGSYIDNVTVNKSLTLAGAGSGTTTISATSGNIIAVAADSVVLQGLKLSGTSSTNGVYFNSTVAGDSLTDVVATGNNYGLDIANAANVTNLNLNQVSLVNGSVGLQVATTGTVNGLTVVGGHFDDNALGWDVTTDLSSTSNQTGFTNINVWAVRPLSGDATDGIYAEKLDHATFNGIQLVGSGYSAASSNPYGINLNLKKGTYSNITMNAILTNNGLGNATLNNPGTGLNIDPDNTKYGPVSRRPSC